MPPQSREKALYWMLTVPAHAFVPYLPPGCQYIAGQLECGGATGYRHWQLLCVLSRKDRLSAVRRIFGDFHAEPTRSAAARDYVWKEDTAVPGTRFELGRYPLRRNNAVDWQAVKSAALDGRFDDVPADIFVRYYSSLRTIRGDHSVAVGIEKSVYIYWGCTGTGKSRLAWEEAGLDAYPKDPRTKFWCGYQGQRSVVIDEFRGGVDIAHLLRWFDRYPLRVEIKGASVAAKFERVYITSNLHPENWYPDVDAETRGALMRRFTEVRHFTTNAFN